MRWKTKVKTRNLVISFTFLKKKHKHLNIIQSIINNQLEKHKLDRIKFYQKGRGKVELEKVKRIEGL